jgi:CheY-like chemotaxis protein
LSGPGSGLKFPAWREAQVHFRLETSLGSNKMPGLNACEKFPEEFRPLDDVFYMRSKLNRPNRKRPIQVLLIEDDPEAAALTLSQVSADGDLFKIEWKDNIPSAVTRLAEPGIDVVLLDLGLRELGGYKTHLALTPTIGKTPVVILTSDDSFVSLDISMVIGASSYLIKNRTSPSDIRKALREAVFASSSPCPVSGL